MWLGVVMPIASYGMQRHDDLVLNLSFCYANGLQDTHHASPDYGDQGSRSTLVLKVCGYCGLLAQHMPLPQVLNLLIAGPGRYIPLARAAFLTADLPLAYAPAHPRAPPLLFS